MRDPVRIWSGQPVHRCTWCDFERVGGAALEAVLAHEAERHWPQVLAARVAAEGQSIDAAARPAEGAGDELERAAGDAESGGTAAS
jgi:hypothetical protein